MILPSAKKVHVMMRQTFGEDVDFVIMLHKADPCGCVNVAMFSNCDKDSVFNSIAETAREEKAERGAAG